MGGPPIPKPILDAAYWHLSRTRPPRGMRWQLTRGQRVSGGWFFVYRIERLPRAFPEQGSYRGIARGAL